MSGMANKSRKEVLIRREEKKELIKILQWTNKTNENYSQEERA